MKRFLLLALLVGVPVAAGAQTQTRFDLLPYFSWLDYGGTVAKERGLNAGVYGYYGYGLHHSIEADVSASRIDFGAGTIVSADSLLPTLPFTLNQVDVTLVYNNFSLMNFHVRAGVHGIFSDDALTDRTLVAFAGLHRYRTGLYNAGVDIFHSNYGGFEPGLRVWQVAPRFGFSFGNPYTTGSFYAETRGTVIKLSESVGLEDERFQALEQSMLWQYKDLAVRGFVWWGEQVFGVRNDGFVVYNLLEKHIGGAGGSVRLLLSRSTALRLVVTHERFREVGGLTDARLLVLNIGVGHTF